MIKVIKEIVFHNKTLGIIDRGIAQVSIVLSVLVFSKILSKEQFGLYGLAMSIFLFLTIFESFFQTATTKFCATNNKDTFKKIISSLLYLKIISIGVAIILMLIVKDKIIEFYKQPFLENILFWFPFLFVVYAIRSHFTSVIKARQDIKGLLVQDIIFSSLYIGLILTFVQSISNTEQIFIIFFIANLVTLVYLIVRYPDFLDITNGLLKPIAKKIFDYGKYTVLAGLGLIMYQNIDILMLGHLGAIEDVGVYKLGRISAVLIMVLSQGILLTLMPQISNLQEQKKSSEIKKLYYKNIKLMLYIFVPFFFISLLFVKPLFYFFFQDKYLDAEVVFIIFSFSGIIRSFSNPQGALLTGVGLVKYDSYQMWGCALLNVLLNLILIPKYNHVGAAFATILALIFGVLLKEYFIRRYYFTNMKSLQQIM